MKKLYLFIILLGAAIATNAQSSNGLVAHWNFNGNVNDASGNGHNGTAYNISYTQGKNGTSNNAAAFNGINSWVNVPHSDSFNISEYSICAILKPTGFYPGTCQGNFILFRGGQFVSGGYGLNFQDNIYNSCTVSDTNKYVFASEVGGSSSNLSQWQTTTRVHTQQWYCVIATYSQVSTNSGIIKMYINGTLENTVNITGKLTSINAQLTLGRYIYFGNQWPYWLNAHVDDIRLYNRVLTTNEIATYCGTSSVPDTTIGLTSLSDSLFCGESTVTASYTTNYNFAGNNIFTLQLSDATGSFASPTNLGTTSATTSGTITGNIGNINPGNYKLRVISSNPVKISNTKSIAFAQPVYLAASVSASPSVNVGPFTPITFTATVPSGITTATYQWKRNGINIPGATNSTYTTTSSVNLNDGDKIHVSVASTQACVNPTMVNSDTLTIGVSLSVNDLEQRDAIRVSPNPNNGTFKLSGIVKTESVQVQIINAIGQTVYRKKVATPSGKLQENIQLTDMANGLYQVRLLVGKETFHIPVQIQ